MPHDAGRRRGSDSWCSAGWTDSQDCYARHCISDGRLGRATGKPPYLKYVCVVCGKHEMLFNPGDKGRWMVWNCFVGCDRAAIRAELEQRISPKCLGGYFNDDHVRSLSRTEIKRASAAQPDPELLATAGKYEALRKLVQDEGSDLLRMGSFVIDQGSGDLPGRLSALLPVRKQDASQFYGIAKQVGLGRGLYTVAKRWFRQMGVDLDP